jgi:hypothetical protein
MPVIEELEKLINDEVEHRMMSRMTKYAEKISLVHGIPIRLLLRDIPTGPDGDTICHGLLKSGGRCSRKAKTDGFCQLHIHQKKSVEPIRIVSEVVHNHSFPPMFKHDCPACQKTTNDTAMRPNFLSTF